MLCFENYDLHPGQRWQEGNVRGANDGGRVVECEQLLVVPMTWLPPLQVTPPPPPPPPQQYVRDTSTPAPALGPAPAPVPGPVLGPVPGPVPAPTPAPTPAPAPAPAPAAPKTSASGLGVVSGSATGGRVLQKEEVSEDTLAFLKVSLHFVG